MAEYRDIGRLNNYASVDIPVDTNRRGQVYQATHEGEQTLPFMQRSFISFTYGGKKIEDFNLIATISGDRMSRTGYSSFEDTVTSYDNLDGLFYWATHYKTNQMDFVLSTDGISQNDLDNFLHWFKAGIHRELILAEHPNRAVMARVAEPPQLELLPFELEVVMKISSDEYKTKTTLYKGDILLSLIMDKPHWYAVVNILGKKVTSEGHTRYVDVWDDVNGNEVSIFASLDALKILLEDGIPLGSMIDANMLLGNGAYALVENLIISLIWSLSETAENYLTEGQGAKIDDGDGTQGIIAGAIVDASDNGIVSLAANTDAYFFYAGTAPAYTTISFTLTPTFSNNYIAVPSNKYVPFENNAYNTITIESLTTLTLRFTTPNIFTSYNKAIEIFNTYSSNSTFSWEDIRVALRDSVRHAKVRAFAIEVMNSVAENAMNPMGLTGTLITEMTSFFINDEDEIAPVTFSFNSETGEATGIFSYRSHYDQLEFLVDLEENVGDMLRSNYIIILDRNYPSSDGKILKWSSANDTSRQYSHRIIHDVPVPLTNLLILYKNMYL